ncbi:MAG: hypothetical protein WD208_09895 [Dehalococcoidia bacterium]
MAPGGVPPGGVSPEPVSPDPGGRSKQISILARWITGLFIFLLVGLAVWFIFFD